MAGSATSEDSAGSSQQLFLQLHDEENANVASAHHWTRKEKYAWFFTLLAGTTALYASRTTMPLVAPAASSSSSIRWSKTETGTVLSSFFWGYTLTQVLGGYLSDRFGAEKVLLAAGMGWGLITFWFHRVVYTFESHDSALRLIVLSRVLWGAFQGVHFPAMASISSRHLNSRDRSFFFSAITAGSAFGCLLTGTLGSYLNEVYGWPYVFYCIGAISLLWVAVLKYYAMELHKQRRPVLGMSSSTSLLGNAALQTQDVPWLTYLKHKSLWACIVCHFCQNNCFFILLSWLPTYFHDNFPGAKSWIFNVVPWALMIPGVACASYVTGKVLLKSFEVGHARKTSEVICMGTEAICLLLMGYATSFPAALLLMAVCMFATGFHNLGSVVNPQDLAPKHSGSVFGIMNAAGALPGWVTNLEIAIFLVSVAVFASSFHKFGTVPNPMDLAPKHTGSLYGIVNTAASCSGFIGVYLAGYILDVTGSWSSVFNVTALINLIGVSIFVAFGSGKPIL